MTQPSTLGAITENALIDRFIERFARSPAQVNRPHEADAELIELAPGGGQLLAVTVDTLAEEMALDFFREPFTVGWMAVMASMSDLAAVGARPLGLLLAVSLPERAGDAFCRELSEGAARACEALSTHVLGGDTNTGESFAVTGCALGLVDRDRVLTRVGCRPGDVVLATGPMGAGNAVAAASLMRFPPELYSERSYRPVARIREGMWLAGRATACMDTSDALVTTLDQLARLNGVGIRVTAPPASLVDPAVLRIVQMTGVPAFCFLAGHHGEFELVFTAPEARVPKMLEDAEEDGLCFLQLGRVEAEPGLRFGEGAAVREVDGARIRNLYEEVGGDLTAYIREINRMGAEIG